MSGIIPWHLVPEATHYLPVLVPDDDMYVASFMQLVDGRPVTAWQVDGGRITRRINGPNFTSDMRERLIKRPFEWSGEGKPPVGVVCDFQDPRGAKEQPWVAVEVKYLSGVTCVLRPLIPVGEFDEIVIHPDAAKFRRHVTADQLAAEERLAAINFMELDAGMVSTAFDGDPEARVWIENLIDKGWRKPEAD